MWHTPFNKKLVINGKLKELFLEGVYQALDGWFLEGDSILDDKDNWALSYVHYSKPYADMTHREKLWALAEVTRCLTTDCEPPELLQWNESVVYAVFETIASEVSVEIDNEKCVEFDEEYRLYWRTLVSETQRERIDYGGEEDLYIDPESQDAWEWDSLVTDEIATLILWDDDFLNQNARIISDKISEKVNLSGQFADIPEDCYYMPVPLVTEKMLEEAKNFLKETFNAIYEKK